jgi:hypothetical protein
MYCDLFLSSSCIPSFFHRFLLYLMAILVARISRLKGGVLSSIERLK